MAMVIDGVVMSAQNRAFEGKDGKPGFTLTELTVAVPGMKSTVTATLMDKDALSDAQCAQMEMQPVKLQVADVRTRQSFVSFRARRVS
ncbi:MAG TPA: hypothetical protein VKT82_33200 [Ktedonobacterales bacterium]|nr:hypothetical protein [Ktedonobacterales bacterium]